MDETKDEDFDIVLDVLNKKLNELLEIQKGSDNLQRSIGGGYGLMDSIRSEFIYELEKAIRMWKTEKAKVKKA